MKWEMCQRKQNVCQLNKQEGGAEIAEIRRNGAANMQEKHVLKLTVAYKK